MLMGRACSVIPLFMLLATCCVVPDAGGQDHRLARRERRLLRTQHEGDVPYVRYRGHWVREHGQVMQPNDTFFQTYDVDSPSIDFLLEACGHTGSAARTDAETWARIGSVWRFLQENTRTAREGDLSPEDRWPSLSEYAYAYRRHGEIPWRACFSKAHVFASILGHMIDRDRVAIASTHHTENGAPPTATHVYVAVYVGGEWFYLDPTAVSTEDFPPFEARRSIGVSSMRTVDYEHPYKILRLPGSRLSRVPLLSGAAHRPVRPARRDYSK